jgi:hypothetical protein
MIKLPNIIPVFPLSNLDMVNDSMETNKLIGLIQPKQKKNTDKFDLYEVGCLGKISNFEKVDGRYLIDLNGLTRFKIIKEIKTDKTYRQCEVTFDDFSDDLQISKKELRFSDLELIFKDLKTLFEKKGYIINWKSLEKQDLNETINALAMASPFSLEEKQILLESQDLEIRKNKIAEILNTYNYDNFDNSTIQ